VSFSVGAILPLSAIALGPPSTRAAICVAATLAGLAILGYAGARLGGARRWRGTGRVLVWGAVAMAATAAIGAIVGAATNGAG
jgi:VIT1/CCC1 family predicted Fe2+/Mn2+ transporter